MVGGNEEGELIWFTSFDYFYQERDFLLSILIKIVNKFVLIIIGIEIEINKYLEYSG